MSSRDSDQNKNQEPKNQQRQGGGQQKPGQQSQNPGHDRGGPARQQGDAGLGKDPQPQDSRKRGPFRRRQAH